MSEVHNGHRKRMRQRIIADGIESLMPHELLEVLLYPMMPRKDTNEIAHKLIDKFGSFVNVLDADVTQLQEFLSEPAAVYLCKLPEIMRKYYTEKVAAKPKLSMYKSAVEYLTPCLSTLSVEEVHLLSLTATGSLIKHERLQRGVANQSNVYIREVVKRALQAQASAVILAHNHPSGNPMPSKADEDFTRRLCVAMQMIELPLFDHIIIGHNKAYSFKLDGNLDSYLNNSLVTITKGRISDIKY